MIFLKNHGALPWARGCDRSHQSEDVGIAQLGDLEFVGIGRAPWKKPRTDLGSQMRKMYGIFTYIWLNVWYFYLYMNGLNFCGFHVGKYLPYIYRVLRWFQTYKLVGYLGQAIVD